MYRRHRVLLLVVSVSLCVGLASARAGAPQRGGTLRIGYWQDMTGMDPHLSAGIPAVYVMQSIFQTLVTLNEELDLVPELAHAWDVQDGGTTEVPDHPAFIKRQLAGEFDQQLTQSYPFIDLGERLRLFLTKARGGLDFARANDAKADALADHYRQTSEASQLQQRGEELLRYVADNAWTLGLTTIPFFDAVYDHVKGFRFRRHLKVDFETVWLER